MYYGFFVVCVEELNYKEIHQIDHNLARVLDVSTRIFFILQFSYLINGIYDGTQFVKNDLNVRF